MTAESFLSVVDKFFVGQQDGEELQAAIKEHMAKVETTEKAAEEKHNKYRRESKERGSTKCVLLSHGEVIAIAIVFWESS